MPFHFKYGPRNVRYGFAVNALRPKRAMIDANSQVRLLQRCIRSFGPTLADVQQLANSGTQANFAATPIVPLERGFRPQALGHHLAGGRQQVGVKITRITSGKVPRRMNGDVHRESITFDQFPRKSSHQTQSMFLRQFGRQGDQILTSDACIGLQRARAGQERRCLRHGHPGGCRSIVLQATEPRGATS